MQPLVNYLKDIAIAKVILWCYLIWYCVIVYRYFDASPKLWMNTIGISGIIGTGLLLSVSSNPFSQIISWQTMRLYMMPFCVSSFSALIKDQGFILIFSPQLQENAIAITLCLVFVGVVTGVKQK